MPVVWFAGEMIHPYHIKSGDILKQIKLDLEPNSYVNSSRIEELKAIKSNKYDLKKLIQLCEEINICFSYDCHLSMMMIIRTILDHVPPIFGCIKFSEIANNYPGSKSFCDSMKVLSNTARKIADQHLHCQIRKSEVLPSLTQVDFSNNLDVLLAEIIRILKI